MNNEFVSKEQKIKLMNLSIEEKVKIDTIEEARQLIEKIANDEEEYYAFMGLVCTVIDSYQTKMHIMEALLMAPETIES